LATVFDIILVVSAVVLMFAAGVAVCAPSLGVSVPNPPMFPSFASNLNWTVSLTNWSGIGSFFVLIGGGIVYFLSYLAYMVSMLSVLFTILGIFGPIATGLTVVILILFIGSLLMFVRGTGGASK